MYLIIKKFPHNLQEAISLIKKAKLNPIKKPIHNILITGMGSSTMAGTLIKHWVNDKLSIPLAINCDYTLPAYVNEHTLLIVVSYSGNTQETIETFQAGIKKKASIIVITSGGELQRMAQEYAIDVLPLPKYLPPRASLDHTTIQVLFILHFHHLIDWDFVSETQSAIQLISDKQASIQIEAEQVAKKIKGYLPVIYTTNQYEGAAIRLRQQLNENSKQLCWHHVLPELNHNEIVGWETSYQNLAVIMFDGYTADKRLELQQKIAQDIIKKHTNNFTLLYAQGQTELIRSLYLIHLSDWISFYLAQTTGIDPMEVKSIDQIKSALYATK
jgi:glucose/mannose-6-phosphate isomerase